MSTIKLTVAQAVIKFLNQQYVARDGVEHKFFAGCAFALRRTAVTLRKYVDRDRVGPLMVV